jgi:hypothetical protein
MKEELKNIAENDYWVYGLNETDFEYTLEIARGFIACRANELEEQKRKVIMQYTEEQTQCEVISDIAHYTWVETQYLWQFCLWRLQGILEGLIIHTFLPVKPSQQMFGLKCKLDALRASGYTISDEEYSELIQWANLRNALSHSPPEQYRPGPLREPDVLEYKAFLEMLCRRWRAEQRSLRRNA